MGYSYWDSFEKNSQSISLHNALQKPNCASTNLLEHIIDNGRFRHLPCEQNTLQWVNNNNEIISIAFPAILDLDGSLSCIPPTFISNSPFERHAKAIFQLSPLKDEYKFEFSKEAMECCASAIDIIQKIYDKAELTIQNHSTENGFSSPFMTFDDEKKEFVFIIIRTNPCFDLSPAFNRFPDVKNKEGRLVFPNEYRSRLENNSIVMVDVHFELEIGPLHHRDYQLILNSMHTLPVNIYEFLFHL